MCAGWFGSLWSDILVDFTVDFCTFVNYPKMVSERRKLT